MIPHVHLVSVDLGVRYLAVAGWTCAWLDRDAREGPRTRWELVDAARLVAPEGPSGPKGDRAAAEALARQLATWAVRWQGAAAELVIEVPTSYPGHTATEPTLERMRRTAAAVARPWSLKRQVEPREWKGNVPKEIHHARALAALLPHEVALWSADDHDVRDAIALGLWAVGRLQRGGVLV